MNAVRKFSCGVVAAALSLAAMRAGAVGPNLIVNGSFDEPADPLHANDFEFIAGKWIPVSATLTTSEPKYATVSGSQLALSAVISAVEGRYRFSVKYADTWATDWTSAKFFLSVNGAKKYESAQYSKPPASTEWKSVCITNDLFSGQNTFSQGSSSRRTFAVDDLAVQLIAPADGALAIAVEPAKWAGLFDVPQEGGRVFADGESETFTCPVQAFLNREHTASMTCTGYRIETWDAEAENWSVQETVTTPSAGVFTYAHTGDGVTAKRLVWTFDPPALAVTPTHVWAGGDAIEPIDFFTAANWRTAGGQAAGSVPGADSVVSVPSPADPSCVATVLVSRAVSCARLLVGSPDLSGCGNVLFRLATAQTNEVSQCMTVFPYAEVKADGGGSYATRFNVGSSISVMHGGILSAKGGASCWAGANNFGTYGGGGTLALTANCYGSIRHPANYGKGGSQYWNTAWGGGILYLSARNDLTVDGLVTADGQGGINSATGGSIWLTMRQFFGKGRITANGALTSYGSGGGGRIALYQTEATDWSGYTGCLTAYGVGNAGAGTIYRETPADPSGRGELIVDNNGNVKSATGITPSVTDGAEPFGKIRVSGARLQVTAGAECVITGALEVVDKGMVTTDDTAGRIELRPPAEETLSVSVASTSTFSAYDLVSTNAGGVLAFAPDSKVTVKKGGFVNLAGDEDLELILQTTEAGTWDLALLEDVTADLHHLAVSNATASSSLVTAYDSLNLGGNTNWAFLKVTRPGDPIAWTGAKDTSWSDGANWDPMRVPCETDAITVPAGRPRYPVMTADFLANRLTVASGASFTLSGAVLTVTNAFACAGTFRCTGAETVRLRESVDFTGGTLDPGGSRFVLEGEADQTVAPGGVAFASLAVERPAGGTVTFTGAFTVTNRFRCVTTVPLALAFAHGVTTALRHVQWDGLVYDSGEGAYRHLLSLESDQEDAQWGLDVRGDPVIRGVTVSDSDATPRPLSPGALATDGGNNDGWTFTAGDVHAWTGMAGNGDFDEPGNWIPAGVPGADAKIVLTAPDAGTLAVTVTGTTARTWAGLRFDTSAGGEIAFTCRPAATIGSSVEIPVRTTLAFASATATNVVDGDLTIRSGGTLTHEKGASCKLLLHVKGDLTVDAGGSVDVTGKNADCTGPGRSEQFASYGGCGPLANSGATVCYGSIRHPLVHGSGGAGWWTGSGGGTCWLHAERTLHVAGTIVSNGLKGNSGGAGGSVCLTAQEIRGAGSITANGVAGNSGGGRIALYQTAKTDWSALTGTVTAYGVNSGGAGTIYRETPADPVGQGELIVNNNGGKKGRTSLSSNVDDAGEPFGRVTVKGAWLRLEGAQALTVTRALTVDANGLIESTNATGAVVFAPGDAAPVAFATVGTGLFSPFAVVCTNGGAGIVVASNATVNVLAGGQLRLKGTDDDLLPLRGDDPWNLALGANVAADIMGVAVSNSCAQGAQVTAYDSRDDGGNTGWSFLLIVRPGDPIVWTGAKDTSWGDGANWDPMRVPCETDAITVPAGRPRYPVMTADFLANRLTVQAGGALTLDGANLTVTNAFTCAGAFACRGAERITLACDASFEGASVEPGSSLVILSAEADQSFHAPATPFANLTVDRPAGGRVAFAGNLSLTGDFRCKTAAPLTLAFPAGGTFAPAKLHLYGFVAGAEGDEHVLSLVSATAGSAWLLKASAGYDVRGVRVQDSDARSGVTMKVGAMGTDDGRNEGWDFGSGAASTWTGAGGNAQFDNPTNWCPAAVPGDGAVVRVFTTGVETNTVTVTGSVARAFDSLQFDTSSGGMIVFTSRAPIALASSLDVPARTTLALDATNELNEVDGNVTLRKGAVLTHSQGDSYKLRLAVTGDMTVESGANVDVTAKGTRNKSYSSAPCVALVPRSHGSGPRAQNPATCYGSVFHPVMHGSGGTPGNAGWGWEGCGGGVVYLSVKGGFTLSGSVKSNGDDTWTGTGGSVWITAGSIAGKGPITATGTGAYAAAGGGRVALYQTAATDWSAYTGTVSAGTTYREHAGDGAGGGEIRTSGNAALPMPDDGVARRAYAKATLRAYDGAVTITNVAWNVSANRLKLRDLVMDTGSTLVLSGSVVVVSSMEHKDGLGWPGGKYRQIVYEGEGGRVEWRRSGFTLIVR